MQPEALFDPAALQAGTKIVLAAALCHGCISDIRRLRIPDSVWLIVIATFFFNYWLRGAPEGLAPHLWAGGIAFAFTFGIYRAGVLGAGDVKLISALVLWGRPQGRHGLYDRHGPDWRAARPAAAGVAKGDGEVARD